MRIAAGQVSNCERGRLKNAWIEVSQILTVVTCDIEKLFKNGS